MKHLITFLLVVSCSSLFAKMVVTGYYVDLNGDTVKCDFLINDRFELHRRLVCIDSAHRETILHPDDIRSFGFSTQTPVYDLTDMDAIDHTHEQTLMDIGYLYRYKTFSSDAEIQGESFLDDSIEIYESLVIGNGKRLFFSVKNCTAPLRVAVYYTKLHPDKPYLTSTIWFMIRDNQLISRAGKKLNLWVSDVVGDYKTLSLLVKDEKIKVFPWDFTLVADDYNKWLGTDKPDTTAYLKGLIDAQNTYKTRKHFILTYVPGTVFFFPGMITAVIVAHNPREGNIKLPKDSQLKDDPDYKRGYQHRAYDKKYRAAGKGALWGGVTCIALLFVIF